MEYSASEYKELRCSVPVGTTAFPTTAMHFDNEMEILWMGNSTGHISSYVGPNLQRFTSFQVDPCRPVCSLDTMDERILSLTQDRFRINYKEGPVIMEYIPQDQVPMRSLLVENSSSALIGGKDFSITRFDLISGKSKPMLARDESEKSITGFRQSSRYLCVADDIGNVSLLDSNSLKTEHVLDAHTGPILDHDVHGHLLVTCGFSCRKAKLPGNLQDCVSDRLIKVYDLRSLRAMSPIQTIMTPLAVRFIPSYTRRLLIMTSNGQFCLIEDNATITATTPIYRPTTMYGNITSMALSKSMQALAFADDAGFLHLWSTSIMPSFNQYQKNPELPPVMPLHDPVSIDDYSIPLSAYAMPLVEEPLLSDWPASKCIPVSRRPPPLDPEIIQSMKVVQGIGYAPNPGNRRRNQVPYKLKDIAFGDKKGKKAAVPDSPLGRDEQPHLYMVPKKYRKVMLKYTKLGFEESGMIEHYNKTNFAGLDPNILNSYCNNMLQVLYFMEPLRCGLQSYHNFGKEFDLAEELGFLFRMKDISKGGVLQASNFLRAFRTIHEATALGLVQSPSKLDQVGTATHENLSELIQNWNRFILQQIHSEIATSQPHTTNTKSSLSSVRDEHDVTLAEKLYGTKIKILMKFRNGNQVEKYDTQFLFSLVYPPLAKPGEAQSPVLFTDVLQDSLCSTVQTKSWDSQTETYQPLTQYKVPMTLPEVLVLNCSLTRDVDQQFWKVQTEIAQKNHERKLSESSQIKNDKNSASDAWNVFAEKEGLDLSFNESKRVGWVPLKIRLTLYEDGDLLADSVPGVKEEKPNKKIKYECLYNLHATVTHVIDQRTGGNLVSHINVGKSYHQRKEGVTHTQWYLFNDFQICAIDAEEAVDFDMQWKIPSVIYYIKEDLNDSYNKEITFPISTSILFPIQSMSKMHHNMHTPQTFTPLDQSEMPTESGMLVALDAEFVTLNNEEAELHSDGTRSTIKPSHLSVARVTCVRGDRKREGVPFIDDYISTQEQVVDYLTKFSGIQPGDLDISRSSKHLSTLKITYCKLNYLLHTGCIFVGHGLSKDFKVLNIVVPKEQVRDTVLLFHLPRKRFISLRFLSWYFLGEKIQENMHDSIEDAKTALKVYNKYLELTADDAKTKEFKTVTLKKLYEEGHKLEWKVPGTTE